MDSKWLSRKLVVALITSILAVVAAFTEAITPEQAAAIIALTGNVYLVANAIAAAARSKTTTYSH